MADKQVKTAHPNQPETSSALLDLGRWPPFGSRALIQADRQPMVPTVALDQTPAEGANPMTAEVELTLADLIGDANGEIVFFNDSGFRRLALTADAAIVADGQAGTHRTASGDDVSGFSFVTFDNGLTLYYQEGLDLVVRAARR